MTPKPKLGRPRQSDEVAVVGTIRLTPDRWRKLRQIGTVKLTQWIDRTNCPQACGDTEPSPHQYIIIGKGRK